MPYYDSNVIGAYGNDDVEGYDDDEIAEIVGEIVGKLRRRRRGGGGPKPMGAGGGGGGMIPVSQMSEAQIIRLAQSRGLAIGNPNPNAGGSNAVTMGRKLMSTDQRRETLAFDGKESVAAGVQFVLVGDVQKGIQVEKLSLTAKIASSGQDASAWCVVEDISIGVRSQLCSIGTMPFAAFAPEAVSSYVQFEPAPTGQKVFVKGRTFASLPGPVNIFGAGFGPSAW